MNGESKIVGGELLAVQGQEGCMSVLCRREFIDGEPGPCLGWHCAKCGEPSSYQGHVKCAANLANQNPSNETGESR